MGDTFAANRGQSNGGLNLPMVALGVLFPILILPAAATPASDRTVPTVPGYRMGQPAIPKPVDRISQPTAVAYLVNGLMGCCISPKV